MNSAIFEALQEIGVGKSVWVSARGLQRVSHRCQSDNSVDDMLRASLSLPLRVPFSC
jgi:hypothetical protein